MSTFLVGYDLDKPNQNYTAIEKKLQAYGTWWHCLDSTWIVKANLTAAQLRDLLNTVIGTSDKILVVDMTADAAAWSGFSGECATWLTNQL